MLGLTTSMHLRGIPQQTIVIVTSSPTELQVGGYFLALIAASARLQRQTEDDAFEPLI